MVKNTLNTKILTPDPDPDYLRGPSHGYNISSSVKNSRQSERAIVFELRTRTDKQADRQANRPNRIILALVSRSKGNNRKTSVAL